MKNEKIIFLIHIMVFFVHKHRHADLQLERFFQYYIPFHMLISNASHFIQLGIMCRGIIFSVLVILIHFRFRIPVIEREYDII